MNHVRAPLLTLVLASAAFGAQAQATTHERLTQLAQTFIATLAADDPIAGSSLGLTASDSELPAPSEGARTARIARLEIWKAELEVISQAAGPSATLAESNDVKLLRADFDEQLNELRVRQSDRKNYAGASLRLVGAIFSQFLHLPIVGREDATQADVDNGWDAIVSRLEKGPAFIVAGQRLATQPGRLAGIGRQRRSSPALPISSTARSPRPRRRRSSAARPEVLARFVAATRAVLATIAATRAYIDAHPASWPENYAIGRAAYEQILQRGAAAALRLGRHRAHGARRAGARLGRGGLAAGRGAASRRRLRRRQRRRHGARRSGADRVLPRAHRRAAQFVADARCRHGPGLARLDGDRRDAGLPAAGVAGRDDELAAPVLAVDHRLLLHHAAEVAGGSGRSAWT